jgi:hypothetical protein
MTKPDINDLLWSDGEATNTFSDPLVAAQESHAASLAADVAEERIKFFRKVLAEVFPKGTPEEKINRGPITVARRIGDHWIGIVGARKPGETEVSWAGFWRQNVLISLRNRGNQQGATIEKATRDIKGDQGAIGWLSWVHREICKVAGEVIRNALHPDQFMPDPGQAFRAAYDLFLLDAGWDDVGKKITQRLPWRPGTTNLGSLCTILRSASSGVPNSSAIGTIGVQQKDGYWRYGGQIKMQEINGGFAMSKYQDWKFKHKLALTACKNLDEAQSKADEFYAHTLFDFLLEKGQEEGFRLLR